MAAQSIHPIADGEVLRLALGDGDWLFSWHAPDAKPEGAHHGAYALCVTGDDQIVLITEDGIRWDGPGGRTEQGETPQQTLIREVLEEACARVERATLLGFLRNEAASGPRKGLVEIRSLWRADVDVLAWAPEFEISERRIETPQRAWAIIRDTNPDTVRLFRRWMDEAGFAEIR